MNYFNSGNGDQGHGLDHGLDQEEGNGQGQGGIPAGFFSGATSLCCTITNYANADSQNGGVGRYQPNDRLSIAFSFDQQYQRQKAEFHRNLPDWAAGMDLEPRPIAPSCFSTPWPRQETVANELYSLFSPATALPALPHRANVQPPSSTSLLVGRDKIVSGSFVAKPTKPRYNNPLKSSAFGACFIEHENNTAHDNAGVNKPQVDAPRGKDLTVDMFGSKKTKVQLSADFEPTEYTVILGRGRGRCTESVGNSRLKSVVQSHLQDYLEAPGKLEKTIVGRAASLSRCHPSDVH
jgi:hypothetical protein